MKAGGAGVLGWLAASVAAFMTAFYMFRLLYMTFYGESRVEPDVAAHAHEAPDAMRAPLMLLALLSALGGVALGFPPEHGMLHRWLEPVFEAAAHPHAFSFLDIILMAISLAVAAAGWHLAYRFYVREPHLPEQWQARWQGTYDLLANTWYVDELYARVIVRPIYWLSNNGPVARLRPRSHRPHRERRRAYRAPGRRVSEHPANRLRPHLRADAGGGGDCRVLGVVGVSEDTSSLAVPGSPLSLAPPPRRGGDQRRASPEVGGKKRGSLPPQIGFFSLSPGGRGLG